VLALVPLTPTVAVHFTIFRVELNQNESLSGWAKAIDKIYTDNSPIYKSLSLKAARVGNLNGLVRDYRTSTKISGNDTTLTGRDYYVVAHGIGWLLQYQAPATRFNDFAADVAAMAASFRLS